MKRTCVLLVAMVFALGLRAAEPSVAGRSLKDWIADLDSKEALIREEALEILPEFGNDAKAAVPKLLQLYEKDAPPVRFRAAIALWRIDGRTDPALVVLTDTLKTATRSKRLQSVQMLLQLGRPAAELAPPVLDLFFGEPDYNLQAQVQSVLAQFGEDAVPAVRDALGRARGDQRVQLLTLVQNLGPAFRGLLPVVQGLRKDADPRTRLIAVRTIYALDPQNKDVLADLIQAGKATEPGTRREALQAALYLSPRPKELVPFYRDFLKDEDLGTRCRAAAALYEADPTTLKETLPVVRKVLQEGPYHTWSMAVAALGWFGPAAKDALPDLVNLLKRPEGRNYAYTIIQACRPIGPDAIPILLDMLEDPQNYYRAQAQQTLSTFGPPGIPKLLPGLQHKNPAVRQAVMDTLLRFGPGGRAAAPDLAKCLKDDDATVRDRALTILENLGPDAWDVVPALREFLRDPKQNEAQRWRAMDALGAIGPEAKAALPDVEPFLKDTNVLVRCRAAATVMRIDPARRGELLPMFLTPLHEKKATPGLTGAYLVQSLSRFDAPREQVMSGLLEFVKNQPADSQVQVAQGLNLHYAEAPEATPVLRELWKSTQVLVKQETAIGLARRQELAAEVGPFLVEQIRLAPVAGRPRYLTALASLGSQGRSAVPPLLDVWRGDTSIDSRFRIAETILLLDPQQTGVRHWLREQFRSNAAALNRQQAARVLAKVDPTFEPLLPTLQRWTKDVNVTTAAAGLEILGQLGEHGKTAVPLLEAALKDPHPLKRARAAYSLWQIEKRADVAVPVLAAVLGESDPTPAVLITPGYLQIAMRTGSQQAATALGEIGPPAKSAVPALRTAESASDEYLRQMATAALRKIEGTR